MPGSFVKIDRFGGCFDRRSAVFGLGVIGGKCDIKYHTHREDIDELASLQREILRVVSQYVRPGGILLYSTCTVAREENNDNVSWIKETLPFVPFR